MSLRMIVFARRGEERFTVVYGQGQSTLARGAVMAWFDRGIIDAEVAYQLHTAIDAIEDAREQGVV